MKLHEFQSSDKSDASVILSLAGHIAEIWCAPDTAAATGSARQIATDVLGFRMSEFTNATSFSFDFSWI